MRTPPNGRKAGVTSIGTVRRRRARLRSTAPAIRTREGVAGRQRMVGVGDELLADADVGGTGDDHADVVLAVDDCTE